MTPADDLDLTPVDPADSALRFRDYAHAANRELVVHPDGEVAVIGVGERPEDAVLVTAAHILAPAIRQMLEPWPCLWCDGTAELPDGCSQCTLALNHYSRAGARFVMGRTVAHAYRDWTHTSCGVELVTLDGSSIPVTLLPAGKLCRRCLLVLIREHAVHRRTEPETPRRPRG